jgi:hypothetical protein
VGEIHSTTSDTFIEVSEDLSGWKSGDRVELWTRDEGDSGVDVGYFGLDVDRATDVLAEIY